MDNPIEPKEKKGNKLIAIIAIVVVIVVVGSFVGLDYKNLVKTTTPTPTTSNNVLYVYLLV
ncbi:MAG: hypothetical protein B2I18_04500 [Cuniculiplasma sp. C_DKE]|nr:MAG: hypothetical protein B2I18_04500 [Cuniculiplasma sp. C_DKE]